MKMLSMKTKAGALALVGLLLQIGLQVSAEAAPPAPADSTGRTYATSVNLNSIITAVAPPQTGSGVTSTFKALSGKVLSFYHVVNNANAPGDHQIRFDAQGRTATVWAGGRHLGDLDPINNRLKIASLTGNSNFIEVTGDGVVVPRVCQEWRSSACAKQACLMASVQGVAAGQGFVPYTGSMIYICTGGGQS